MLWNEVAFRILKWKDNVLIILIFGGGVKQLISMPHSYSYGSLVCVCLRIRVSGLLARLEVMANEHHIWSCFRWNGILIVSARFWGLR